jgi:hypothetical protein
MKIGVKLGTCFGLLIFAASGLAQTYHFASIDVPCSGCPGGIARLTNAQGINSAGVVVGTYKDAANAQHGYMLWHGQFTTIDFPGSVTTIARGINPGGQIVGSYTDPVVPGTTCSAPGPQCLHGFLYAAGVFQSVGFDGHPGSIAQRITPDGTIYGCLHDLDTMGSMYGARWGKFGNSSLLAGGGELADSNLSFEASMNNGATPDGSMIVGLVTDMMTNQTHGYIVLNGVLRSYDVPGSIVTNIWDVNPDREFVGLYVDASGKQHGFVQPSGVSPIQIDFPGASSTSVIGINPAGEIVGAYTMNGKTHGFVAIPD